MIILLILFGGLLRPLRVEAVTVKSCERAERIIRRRYQKNGRKVKFYESADLSSRRLRTRKNRNIVIVEKVTGTVVNPRTGRGKADGWYINYKSVKGIRKGSKVTSYFVYNPKTNYLDDIIARFDVVIKR